MFEKEDVSYRRNPQIAKIFYLYKYGTHLAGRGKKHMEEEMQNTGLQPPKYDINRNRAFQVTFFRPSNRLPKKIDQSKEFKTLIAEGIESLSQKKSLLTTLLDRNTAMPDYHFSIEDLQRGFIPTDPILIAALALAFVRHGKKNQEWTQKFLEAAKHPNPPDLITKLYPRKFLAKVKQFQNKKLFRILAAAKQSQNKKLFRILAAALLIICILTPSSINPSSLAIGVVKAPDGELIGLSDGTYIVTTQVRSGSLK
jgi:hypothetical protein